MTCTCSSLKLKECRCKLYGYPALVKGGLLGQVERTDPCCSRRNNEKGTICKVFELLYNKCAAYNLRYCPLRKAVNQDKYLTNAVIDLVILMCFLIANLVVFIIILTRTVVHIFAVFKATGYGIKKYFTTSDSIIMPVTYASVGTLPLAKHDFRPPR